jgi:hypothetical protein
MLDFHHPRMPVLGLCLLAFRWRILDDVEWHDVDCSKLCDQTWLPNFEPNINQYWN